MEGKKVCGAVVILVTDAMELRKAGSNDAQ
jgi:hypothetical protein